MEILTQLDAFGENALYVLGWVAARPLYLLLALMVLDIVSGLLAGGLEGRLSSKVSLQGMTRKAAILLGTVFGVLLQSFARDQYPDLPPLGQSVTYFYCVYEGMSILENLSRTGVPLPPYLRPILDRVLDRTQVEKGGTIVLPSGVPPKRVGKGKAAGVRPTE